MVVLFQQERTTAPFLHDKRNFGEHNKICRSGADEEEEEWVARRTEHLCPNMLQEGCAWCR